MIIGDDYINVIIDGKPRNVSSTHHNYNLLIQAIKDKDLEGIKKYSSISSTLEGTSGGLVTVVDDIVFYDGAPCHNVVANKILKMLEQGFDVSPMIEFLQNLMKNPASYAIDQLYAFLEANELPITSDGHLLAYKVVTSDFLDKHTRTFNNSVGQILTMDRDKCNPNRDVHCSTGLHFCGLKYIKGFGCSEDKIIIVKINPADVTSFPSDNFAKGRCCRYEVVDVYGDYSEVAETEKWDTVVDSSYDDDPDEGYDEEYDDLVEDSDGPDGDTTDELDDVSYSHVIDIPPQYDNPIRQARHLAEIGQAELADHAGYSKSTLYNAERFDNRPKVETIERWINDINDILISDKKGFTIHYQVQSDGSYKVMRVWA